MQDSGRDRTAGDGIKRDRRAIADALLFMAHAIWAVVIPRVTCVNHDRPRQTLCLRDVRFLMLYGEVFFHARAKVAKLLLRQVVSEGDKIFAIGEAFHMRSDALGQKMYHMYTVELANLINPIFLITSGADPLQAKKQMRDTIDRLASETFLVVCSRGTVQSFDWIWSMQKQVIVDPKVPPVLQVLQYP